MYKIKVILNDMNNKESAVAVYPFFIWMFLFFALFFIMYKTKAHFLLIPLIIEFLCIIPIFIFEVKILKRVREKSFETSEIELHSKERHLYTEDIKLDISYYKELNSISLLSYDSDGNVVYCADVCESEINGLLEYCRFNGIEVTSLEE